MHSLEWVSKTEETALILMYHCRITSSMLIDSLRESVHQCPDNITVILCVNFGLLLFSLHSSRFLSFLFRQRGDRTSERKAGKRRSTPGVSQKIGEK